MTPSSPTPALAPLSSIPSDIVSLDDYERHARDHISHPVYEYIFGGGADEITLRRNRTAFDDIFITPQVLTDVTHGGAHTRILGDDLRHPVLLAPVAFHQMVHPGAEIATAQAADALETGMVVSTLATRTLEEIATETSAAKWFQLYIQESREFTLELVRRAEAAGYTQIMITVDAALHGVRNRAQRAGFELPPGVEAVNLANRPPLPRAILEPEESIIFQGMMREAPTWDDIAFIRANTKLPVTLKGVMNPNDALKAQAMGVAGLVISNHGGRTLDGMPAAIEALPAIRAAVGPGYPLILDSGVRRGTDTFKAIALGADAVMIGRPQLYALSVAGALGVAHMLRVIREELEITMALAGTPRLSDISDALITRAHR